MERLFSGVGALFGFVGVLTRALSAHALAGRLAAAGRLEQFNLASDYLLLHGLALLVLVVLWRAGCGRFAAKALMLSGVAFVAGVVLFCGTVFIKCFVPMGAAGVLTPVGGSALMMGWLLLAAAALRHG